MQNLKTPQGTVKKGIAHFRIGTVQTAIGDSTGINLFNETIFNNSNNIVQKNANQIILKAGSTYSLKANILFNGFSDLVTGYISFRWTNYSTSTVLGSSGFSFPLTVTGHNWSNKSSAEAVITCLTDTIVGVASDGVSGTAIPQTNSSVIIEELEAYLIPTNPTKYTDVINYTSATGSVLIPSGLPVGTKKLIRKLNATQGTVAITCTDETFTSSNLSSVTLNADGDFWLVEKVNATRWDLVDGKESGSNGNGNYYRYANGEQKCMGHVIVATIDGQALYNGIVWDFPISFNSATYYIEITQASAHGDMNYSTVTFGQGAYMNTSNLSFAMRMHGVQRTGVAVSASIVINGKWY